MDKTLDVQVKGCLYTRFLKTLIAKIREQVPDTGKNLIQAAIKSYTLFDRFEGMIEAVVPVISSGLIKCGVESVDDDIQEEIFEYIHQQYPVYEGWERNEVENVSSLLTDIYRAIVADSTELTAIFSIENPLFPASLDLKGDRHRGGKTVALLEYDHNKKVLYKPRSLNVDKHFGDLLDFFQKGTGVQFRSPKVLTRAHYGWEEFISQASCSEESEVEQYHVRVGGLLAILYMLNASDFHYENIICCGPFPVLIDIEAALAPYFSLDGTVRKWLMEDNVLSTGLLPTKFVIKGEGDDKNFDVSGLSDVEGQESILPQKKIEYLENGDVVITHENGHLQHANNVVMLGAKKIDSADYASFIVKGFELVYRYTLEHKEDVGKVLDLFRGDDVRVLFRDTVAYSHLLREANNASFLHDEKEIRKFIHHGLNLATEESEILEAVAEHEEQDLMNRDFPLFSTKTDSKNLWYSDSSYMADFFLETGLERVEQKLRYMNEKDCNIQSWLIQTSLSFKKNVAKPGKTGISPDSFEKDSTEDLLKKVALKVFDFVKEHIVTLDNGGANWICLNAGNYSNTEFFIGEPALDLFSGMPGEILYLAYLGELLDNPEAKQLFAKAYTTIQEKIEDEKKTLTGTGLYTGWGGVIYMNTCLYRLTRDESYLTSNRSLLRDIDFDSITAKDTGLGMVNGSAGFICALVDYYKASSDKLGLERAIKAADYLMSCDNLVKEGDGIGWRITSSRPLAGLSHGAAGFALAFLRLYEITKDVKYKEIMHKIISYENSLYSEEHNNWKDLREHIIREKDDDIYPVGWAHGAGGVGLVRLEMLRAGIDDPTIRKDYHRALKKVAEQGFSYCMGLNVGSFGNIELLHQSSLYFQSNESLKESYEKLVRKLAALVLTDNYTLSYPVRSLGLMAGVTGIGYESLRLLAPKAVRSVLVL